MGGSIIKDRRDNKWCVSVYWEGKRYRIYRHPITREPFYSKQSAQKQLDKIRCEVDEGRFNPKSWMPDSPISMRIYCQEWLKTLDVSKKTLTGYKTAVNKYIVPFFGNKDIRNIRYNDIVKFKNRLPLEDKGKYNIIGVLKKILRDVWRNEDITHVPPFPKLSYNHPEIEYLTLDQQENILKAIPARHRPIFQFMMEYGVRPQEARALQRDSIKDGKIIIRRVFSDNTLREGTKTGSKGLRIFEVTSYMREVFISMSERKIESPFVFIREDGKPYTSKNLNAIWHEAEEKARIRCKLYNAVRHSLGCQLLNQGEDMDLVREILGHTKAEMTRRYVKRKVTKSTEALRRRRKKIIKFKAKDES